MAPLALAAGMACMSSKSRSCSGSFQKSLSQVPGKRRGGPLRRPPPSTSTLLAATGRDFSCSRVLSVFRVINLPSRSRSSKAVASSSPISQSQPLSLDGSENRSETLVEALVDVLGSHVAATEAISRAAQLRLRKPEHVRAIAKALTDVLGGGDAMVSAVSRSPALLLCSATSVRTALPAIAHALESLQSAMLEENPDAEVEEVEDVVADLVVKVPSILQVSPAGARASADALRVALGATLAHEVVSRSPRLLCSRAATLTESADACVRVLGLSESTELIRRTPSVLRSKAATIEAAADFFRETFGEEQMQHMLGRNVSILGTKRATLEGSWQAWRDDVFGGDREAALDFVTKRPQLLRSKGESIVGSVRVVHERLLRREPEKHFKDGGGDDGDGDGDSALNPDDVLAALRKIGPYAATCKPEHISGVIDALSDAMGSAGAARNTCLSYPRVLSLHPGTLRSRLTMLESALDDRLGGNSVDERRRLLSESSSTVGRLLRESFDVTNARAFADKLCEDV